MVKLVVGLGLWIGQTEEVILVTADRGLESSGFKDCLSQHYLGIFYIVLLDLCIKIRYRQFR